MTLHGDLRVNHRKIGEWWATRQPGTVDVHHYRWGVRVDGSDWMYGELAHREADGAAVLAAKVLAASRAVPDAGGLTEDEIAYAIAGVYGESCGWGANRPVTAFDRQQIIEDAARAMYNPVGQWPWGAEGWRDNAKAAHPVIVAAVLKPIREQVAEWREFMRDPDLTGYERSAIRMCASEMERLLDQIKAAAKGGE